MKAVQVKQMIAAQINRYGGADAVEINKSAPVPQVAKGQVLVEVFAAGVNPVDWKVREGYMKERMPLQFPATLGRDFSGVIMNVGDGVTGLRAGDEVYGQAGFGQGSFAEFVLVDAGTAARKPRHLSHLEAGALPLVGVSALQALVDHMNLSKGERILIHGGAGGIGSIAIQIAKNLGAHVATTCSTEDLNFVRELGADQVIDYTTQSFETLAHDCDAVFDTVAGETYKKSFQVLKKGGIIVSMLEQPDEGLMKEFGVRAIGQMTQVTAERLSRLTALVDQGVIKVHIDKTFPLEQAAEALRYQKSGHPRGKVVLKIK